MPHRQHVQHEWVTLRGGEGPGGGGATFGGPTRPHQAPLVEHVPHRLHVQHSLP